MNWAYTFVSINLVIIWIGRMVIIAISSLGTSLKYRMNRWRDREREKYIYLLQELAWRVYVYVYVQPTWLSGPAVLMMNSQTIFKSSTSQPLAFSLVTSFHMNSKWNIQNGLIKNHVELFQSCLLRVCCWPFTSWVGLLQTWICVHFIQFKC